MCVDRSLAGGDFRSTNSSRRRPPPDEIRGGRTLTEEVLGQE